MRCKSLLPLLIVAPFALFAGCASVSAGADFDPGIRLDQYRTFDWGGGDTLPVGDPRLDNNPFFDSRVRAAVELELAARGLTRATTKPDLLIHYHASIRQRVDVMRADEVRGYTYYGGRSPDRVVEFDEGTLILDVAEAGAKRILWRGWAQTDVGELLNDPRAMEKRISESLRMMMQRFPRSR
jgi:Domain of unknown function (DUF4136)